MPNTAIRLLTGVQIQNNGTAVVTSPEAINFKTGASFNVQETPSGTAEVTLPLGSGLPIETGTVFGSQKLYIPSTKSPNSDYVSVGTVSQTLNRYYASFWIAPRTGVIGECKIQKSTVGTSSANQRIAFFNPTSQVSLGIADLIEQSGSIAPANDGSGSSTHWVWTPSAISVVKDTGYWIICVSDATVSVFGSTQTTSGSWQSVIGWQVPAYNATAAISGSQAGFTFGSFNSPFDGTFSPDGGARPIVWINYSS